MKWNIVYALESSFFLSLSLILKIILSSSQPFKVDWTRSRHHKNASLYGCKNWIPFWSNFSLWILKNSLNYYFIWVSGKLANVPNSYASKFCPFEEIMILLKVFIFILMFPKLLIITFFQPKLASWKELKSPGAKMESEASAYITKAEMRSWGWTEKWMPA